MHSVYSPLGLVATCLVGSNIIYQHTIILTNSAKELTPYRFELKPEANRTRKYFISTVNFETGSLRRTKAALANSALPLLYDGFYGKIKIEFTERISLIQQSQNMSKTGLVV